MRDPCSSGSGAPKHPWTKGACGGAATAKAQDKCRDAHLVDLSYDDLNGVFSLSFLFLKAFFQSGGREMRKGSVEVRRAYSMLFTRRKIESDCAG